MVINPKTANTDAAMTVMDRDVREWRFIGVTAQQVQFTGYRPKEGSFTG
jgi:hypothetical protein